MSFSPDQMSQIQAAIQSAIQASQSQKDDSSARIDALVQEVQRDIASLSHQLEQAQSNSGTAQVLQALSEVATQIESMGASIDAVAAAIAAGNDGGLA